MASDKLIDVLNQFQKRYADALGTSLAGGSTQGGGEAQGHVASGKLGKSLGVSKQPKVKLFGQVYRMQISMLDYGFNLDEGIPAGKWTPSSALFEWLKYPNVRSKFGADKAMDDKKRKSLAFVIARSHYRKGVTAKHWIDPALDSVTPDLYPAIADAVEGDLLLTIDTLKKFIEG